MRGSLKFAYEALNCTSPNWIALNRTMQSQPQPASAYHHARSLLFWDITKPWVVIPYWCFRTTYQFHLQGSRNPKRRQHDWSYLTQSSFLGLCPLSNFLKKKTFQPAPFLISGKEAPTQVDHLDWDILNHWTPQKPLLAKICTWEQI
jgi:hypothetical protein